LSHTRTPRSACSSASLAIRRMTTSRRVASSSSCSACADASAAGFHGVSP
jgi:hypothetical protein